MTEWKRTLKCHCGVSATVDQGSVHDEAQASGFFPVFHFGGEIRWFCPTHTEEVRRALQALHRACGGGLSGLVPPMFVKLAEGS